MYYIKYFIELQSNKAFRSLKRSISQRQKGRFAKPVNIS